MNYLVDEFVFDLQLFAADFDPWADFDADETSEDVQPEVPEGTESVDPDEIASPEDFDPEKAEDGDMVYDEETANLIEGAGVEKIFIDLSKRVAHEITDEAGTIIGYYYTVPTEAISAAEVDGEATIGGVQFNSSGSIVVNFGEDASGNYTGVPTSFSAGNAQVVLGGENGTAIDISDATSPVTVELSEDGLPKEATVNGNATITVGNPNGEVAEAGSESVEFAGFPTTAENKVEFSESGKHITAINASTYEDGTITVTGALDYTLNGEEFELRNVADGASYTFTNLADGDMQLNLSGVEAKNKNKPITIEDLGGVDEVIPPTATTGGSIKIAGDTYEYTTIANSEARFILDNDEVIAFTLDLTGDSITLDANSKIKVYDRDDVEEVYTEDVNANGGTYTFTKTADGYNFGYTFTAAGNSIEVLNEDADNVSLAYVDKKVTYEIVEPEVEGTYTVSMPTKGQFVYSGIDADATFELDDAVISFENDGGAITLAATTNQIAGTASLAVTAIDSNGGDIYFDAEAADWLDDGITINGDFVQLDDLNDSFVYHALDNDNGGTITVDADTVYKVGDGTFTFNGKEYTVAGEKDGIVLFTVDDDGNTEISELNGGSVTGALKGLTVNGQTVNATSNASDGEMTVTGNESGVGIANTAFPEDAGGSAPLTPDDNGNYTGTFNGKDVVVVPGIKDGREITVITEVNGKITVLGIWDGDTVTLPNDGTVKLTTGTGTDGSSSDVVTVNGVTYTIRNDQNGLVNIVGENTSVSIDDLDENASLKVNFNSETPFDVAVNGVTHTAEKITGMLPKEWIVSYLTKAGSPSSYMQDATHPIINSATPIISDVYLDILNNVLDMPSPGDVVSESGKVTTHESLTSYDFTTEDRRNTSVLAYLDTSTDNDVIFNDKGGNIAVVGQDPDATYDSADLRNGIGEIRNSTKNITLGNRNDVVIVRPEADDSYSEVNVTGGTGDDTVVVQGSMPVTFDMSKGGADKVLTYATANARITLDGYSDTTGAGIVIHEPEALNIASAIEGGLLMFEDGKVVTIDRDETDRGGDRKTEIVVNNNNPDHQTLVRLFTAVDTKDNYSDDKGQLVGFTGSDGGKLDASDKSEDLILVGNTSGKKDGSELKAGKGDDTIYGGKGDTLDAGAGDNLVKLTADGGAKVVIAEGNTTVTGLTTGFSGGDIISLNSVDGVTFDGNNLVLEGNGYTATAAVTESDGVVEQLIELNGQTLKAAIAADGQNISVSGSDVPNYFVGNAGVDFSNYSGDVVYDAANNGGSVGGEDAYFSKNITSITGGTGTTSLKGSDADDVFVAGTGATSLYGGAGNNTLVGNADQTSATEFFVLGNENGAANTIQNFQFGTDFINTDFEQNYISNVALVGSDVKLTVTKREGTTSETALIEGAVDGGNIKVGSGGDAVAVGQFGSTAVTVDGEATYFDAVTNGATVKVASDVTTKTNIWLANEERSDGKIFSDKFAVIDASGSVAELELAGNTLANTITAGSGNASLWGGSGSASDVLIGGAGQNTFYYEQGNGADTINNANDGDTVNLFDTSLENIVSADITSTGVVVQFTDGGSLTVNSTNAVNYQLSDGSTWTADHTNKTWTQKA